MLALGIDPAAAQGWLEYRSPGGGYRVEFPGKPEVTTEDVKAGTATIRVNMAMVERGNDVAFLTIDSPRSASSVLLDPQKALDQARDGAIKEGERKLREETRVTVGGLPARRVIIDIPPKKLVTVALFVLGPERLYQAIAVVPPGQEGSADVERFLNSFAPVN